jgi:DNA-directed RNA polymerase subunit E'/Rpb7
MKKEFTIKDWISIPSSSLDKNLYWNIYRELYEKKKFKAFKDYGYVTNISNLKILNSIIVNEENFFLIQIDLETIFFEIDDVATTQQISKIIKHNNFFGIIFSFQDNFEILILNIHEMKCKCFENISENKKFEIKFKITNVSVKNEKYVLIGKHFHDALCGE